MIRVKFIKLFVFQMMVGAILTFFYGKMTVTHFNEYNLKIKNIIGEKTFNLPFKQRYLLKIWGDDVPEKVYFNGNFVTHSIFRNRKHMKEFHYVLPPEIIKIGADTLRIIPDKRYSMRIKNAIVATGFGVVVFKNSGLKKTGSSLIDTICIIFIIVLLGLFIFQLIEIFFIADYNRLFFGYAISYLPCIALLVLIHYLPSFLPVELLFIKSYYFAFCGLFILSFQIPFILFTLIKESFDLGLLTRQSLKIGETGKRIANKIAGYSAIRWLITRKTSDRCILIFIFLLFASASYLILKLEFFAAMIGNLAYLFLIVAVFLKLKNK